MEGTRQKVSNPFSMGPAVNRPKYQPDLQSRVPSRQSFDKGASDGTYIADALIKFAGVAGDAYVAKMDKKVKMDKAVQSARAVQGMVPSDDATVAGERSHALIAANNLSMKAAYRLDEFAKTNPTQDEWEEAIRAEGDILDAAMLDRYANYETDKEMQELAILSFREKMPGVSMKREGYKLGFKEEKRIDTLTDSTILDLKAISSPMLGKGGNKLSASDKVEAIMPGILGKLKSSQLTESQKDTVLSGSILRAGTKEGIELAKQYKGARSTSLFERTASLQAMDKKMQADATKQDKYASLQLRRSMEKAYLDGEILPKDLIAYAKQDDAMTPSEVEAIMDKKDKTDAEADRQRRLLESINNPTVHSDPNTTASEYQAGLKSLFESSMEIDTVAIESLPEEEQEEAKANIRSKNIRQTTNNAVAEGIVFDPVVNDLKMVASADIALINKGNTDLSKITLETTPKEFQSAFKDFSSMSPSSQQAHLDKLSSYEAEVWRTAYDAIKGGVPHLQAFQNAQRTAKVPKAYKAKPVQKGVAKVLDNLDGWFDFGVSSSQEQYVNEMVRAEVSRADDPESDNHTKRVSDSFEKQYTKVDGIYYKGTYGALKRATGLNTDKLTSAFDAIKKTDQINEKISAASKVFRFNAKDVFATIDPVLNTFQFRSPDGAWISPTYPLSEVPKMQRVQKVEAEKKMTEEPGFFEKWWNTGKEFTKRSIFPTQPEDHWKDKLQF